MNYLDPYEAFGATLRRSRPAMERAFLASFEAHRRCSDLIMEHLSTFDEVLLDASGFPIFA